jgi:hypothetical protein
MRVPGLTALAVALSVGAVIGQAKAQALAECINQYDGVRMVQFCGTPDQLLEAAQECGRQYPHAGNPNHVDAATIRTCDALDKARRRLLDDKLRRDEADRRYRFLRQLDGIVVR